MKPSENTTDIAQADPWGLRMFAVYVAIYLGFIVLSAFGLEFMAQPALWGVNWAIIYGFGLIVGAIVLALIYMIMHDRARKNL